jgi:putative exporter of polyketide antibiotics
MPTTATLRLARRQIADSRRRTLAFGALFAGVAYIQPVAYRHTYPTIAERQQFARSFADDKAIRLFYGVPHDLLSVGGYTSWRVGAVLAVIAAVWAMLAAAGALRGEEDARRSETELARVGSGSITTPAGYLGFVFLVFVLVLSLFACSQVAAARGEELEGRLETVLAGALSRARWLGARLIVATAGASVPSRARAGDGGDRRGDGGSRGAAADAARPAGRELSDR